MSVLTKFRELFGSDATPTCILINDILSEPRKASVDGIIAAVQNNQPDAYERTYVAEIELRDLLYANNQRSIMASINKARYPESAGNRTEQVNLPVFKGLIDDRAKVFASLGEFELLDERGEVIEDEDNAIRMMSVMESARFPTALQEIDAMVQRNDAGILRAWYDPQARCARASVWSPRLVYAVADPWLRWSADACACVLFKMPGLEGVKDKSDRYEVLAKSFVNGQWLTLHYYVFSEGEGEDRKWRDSAINEEFAMPFVDPLTNEPIYPFVWWRLDDAGELYPLNNEDITTPNIMANCILTDLAQHIKYKAGGLLYGKQPEGDPAAIIGKLSVGPENLPMLPPGCSIEAVDLDIGIDLVSDFVGQVLRLNAKFLGQNPNAMRDEGSTAESGYKARIERLPLEEHRQKMVPIYKPLVEDSLRRLLIVHNTYAEQGEQVRFASIRWTPGETQLPTDEEAQARTDALLIAKNIITPIDIVMRRDRCSRQAAEETVRENAEINKELAAMGVAGSLMVNAMPFTDEAEEDSDKDGEESKPVVDREEKPTQPSKPQPVEQVDDDAQLRTDPGKVTVYHIAKAIETGAASVVDLRMFLFGESEEDARRALKRVAEDTKASAKSVGEAAKIEADASGEEDEPNA